jgi:hypothetical protein
MVYTIQFTCLRPVGWLNAHLLPAEPRLQPQRSLRPQHILRHNHHKYSKQSLRGRQVGTLGDSISELSGTLGNIKRDSLGVGSNGGTIRRAKKEDTPCDNMI